MSVNKNAIEREKAEPTELDQRIPALFLVFIGLMGGWGSSYFYYNADNSHGRGDTRSKSVSTAQNTDAVSAIDGKAVYTTRCSSCHQSTGMGLPGAFPPLKDSEWVTGSATVPVNIVLRGLQGEIEVQGSTYNGVMPSFASQLTDDEIAALLTYVRTDFGGLSDASVDAEMVSEVREAKSDTAIQGQAGLLAVRDGRAEAVPTSGAESKENDTSTAKDVLKEVDEGTEMETSAETAQDPTEVTTEEPLQEANDKEPERDANSAFVNGQKVYQQVCSSCHQSTGLGIPGAFPPLKGSEWTNREPELIATIIQRGLMGEIEVAGTKYVSAMPALGPALSPEDMVDVVTYVQTEFAGVEAKLNIESVNQIRAKSGAPINGQTELRSLFPQ